MFMGTNSAGQARFLKKDLLRRGWTEGLIERFLGEPDEMPHRYGGGYYCVYNAARVKQAEANPEWQQAVNRRKNRREHPPQEVDLLAAIFSVTRSAKRYRDAAQTCYRAGKHGFAGQARRQKVSLYALKDRGIAAACLAGRIAPVRRVGDGFVEYRGEGYCYHSTLFPTGLDVPVAAGSQPLLVEAKPREAAEPKLKDAVYTLKALPEVPDRFARLVPEWQRKQQQERRRKQLEYEQACEQRWRDRDDEVCSDCGELLQDCQCEL